MKLTGLLPLIKETAVYQQLLDVVEGGSAEKAIGLRGGEVLGVIQPARPFLVAALYRELRRPILLLTARAERIGYWTDQLRVWTGSEAILPFPEPDPLPYERVPWTRETVTDRLTALTGLVTWKGAGQGDRTDPPLVIASARALMHKTLPIREFRLGLREYRREQEVTLQRMLDSWVAHGYRPETVVEEPGTFSRRGGLIDVFPPNLLDVNAADLRLERPVRIELFGDEIDSLRVFDPTSQRSLKRIEGFALAPATEALPRLASPAGSGRRSGSYPLPSTGPDGVRKTWCTWSRAPFSAVLSSILPFFYSHPATLLDYLPADGLCLVDDWDALMAAVVDMDRQAQTLQADLIKAGELPESFRHSLFRLGGSTPALVSRQPLVLGGRPRDGQPGPLGAFAHGERYGGQLKRVLGRLPGDAQSGAAGGARQPPGATHL